MNTPKSLLCCAIGIALLASSGCAYVSKQRDDDIACLWGSSQFDLCAYNSQQTRVQALIDAMTLDEKIGQMTMSIWHNNVTPDVIQRLSIGSVIHTEGPVPGPKPQDWIDNFDKFQRAAAQSRLGIPLLVGVDAVHGQNTFESAVIFPHNIGMAATRNIELIQKAAEITAIEAAGTGFNWTFSPCIAMPEHEHWGRVYEGFSEDRDFTIAATIASVAGYQGSDLDARNTIAATAKHYLGDGATQGGIEGGNAVLSYDVIRARHLPTYAAAVEQDVASIMVGFNAVNGIPMHQHTYLVNDVLKGELGFDGVVLTDWNGGLRFGEPHTVINAGVDIAMQPGNHEEFMTKLKSSVEDGTVSMTRIDDAVRRILNMKYDLGLFHDPYSKQEFAEQIGKASHRAVARQAVRESLVLLKNDSKVLPLALDEPVAVVGEHADNSGLQSGGWSIHWQGQKESYAGSTTILDGIRQFSSDVEFSAQGCSADMQANIVVAVVGESPYAEGVGDTEDIYMTPSQQRMIEVCKEMDKEVITILISGRPLIINEPLALSDAFIAAWLPGSEGAGVADVLFAVDNTKPTGSLPHAWPARYEDIPLAPNDENALFPLGFGLKDF